MSYELRVTSYELWVRIYSLGHRVVKLGLGLESKTSSYTVP